MMQQFRDRSLEELRYQDYATGVKGDAAASSAAPPSNSLFGASSATPSSGLFGASSSGFGQSSGFGAPQQTQGGFVAASSSAGLFGTNAFGASNPAQQPASGFGATATPSAFAAPQSGGGMFGSSVASTPFGAPQAAAQQSGFGGGGFAQSAQVPGQTQSQPLFGQTGGGGLFATPAPNPLFGAPAGIQSAPQGFAPPQVQSTGNGLFGNSLGSSAPSGFGAPSAPQQGGLFGANSASAFGAPTALPPGVNPQPQVGSLGGFQAAPGVMGGVPGAGSNPTLADSYNAVVLHSGTTVAPSGANYGTVLYNLQKLQKDLGEYNREMAQQQQQTDPAAKKNESVSVIVMPPPQMVKIATNRLSFSSGNVGGGMGAGRLDGGLPRTPMRGVASRSGSGAGRVSGTPVRYMGMHHDSRNGFVNRNDDRPKDSSERMPFFTPQQFSGAKRKPLRASQLSTPLRMAALITPASKTRDGDRGGDRELANGVKENGVVNKPDENSYEDAVDRPAENGSTLAKEPDEETTPPATKRQSNDFMWSAKRPSQWSVNIGVKSPDQYDASKYLPRNSRTDYYTIPHASELAVRTMTELQHVENFAIGRHGFGKVEWVEPVDIRGLNLDECVDISLGSVSVLPQMEASQLDAAAVITLEQMMPKMKKIAKDSDRTELYERFSKKLQRYCETSGTEFISYDAESHTWKFRVNDFSE